MLNLNEILLATNGKLLTGKEKKIKNYSISSNEIEDDCMFIPLKGEKTDGHKYIVSAVKNKVIGFFINKEYIDKEVVIKESLEENKDLIIIEVEDTLKALKDMAKYVRNKFINIPVIAVTGSVGKTSTREIINSVLIQKYKVLKTVKNYNSDIGISLMLLKYDGEEMMLLETGMDGIGQLEEISSIIKPDISVITNIGTAHIGILGSKEKIYKAKMEITKSMKNNGCLYINDDDEYLSETKYKKLKRVSLENVKNISIEEEQTKFDYMINNNYEHFVINAPGKYQIYNAIFAIELGIEFGIDIETLKKGIEKYKNFEKRMQKEILSENITIIDDSYNASLVSMENGLEVVDKYNVKNKIIVLGDMLELGEYSNKIHSALGREIEKYKFNKIYLYGSEIENAYKVLKNKDNVMYTKEIEKISKDILNQLKKNQEKTIIYFKASNGMKLYRIIEEIKSKI